MFVKNCWAWTILLVVALTVSRIVYQKLQLKKVYLISLRLAFGTLWWLVNPRHKLINKYPFHNLHNFLLIDLPTVTYRTCEFFIFIFYFILYFIFYFIFWSDRKSNKRLRNWTTVFVLKLLSHWFRKKKENKNWILYLGILFLT